MTTLSMVLAGGPGERLRPLTDYEAKPAVTFGGTYRIIDFTLSSCMNSGLRQIYVLTQYKSRSLMHHLQEGWNISGSDLGDFIYPVPAQQMTGGDWYRGTADAVRQNIGLIEEREPDDILIVSADHVYKMNYQSMIDYHREKDADLTVAAIELPKNQATRFGVIEIDDNHRMIDFEEKPKKPKTINGSDRSLVSMGIYLFGTHTLLEALKGSGDDFGRNIIPNIFRDQKVFVYPYINNRIRDYVSEMHDGIRRRVISDKIKDSDYWRDIGTIQAYFEANMDLVGVDPALDLYGKLWPLRTLRPQYPPAKFIFGGRALDSIVSDGCIISGGSATKSVLSPGVIVERDAQIEEAILLHDVEVGGGSQIRKAIIGKGVILPPGTVIGYNSEEDARRGLKVDDSGIVVVTKVSRI